MKKQIRRNRALEYARQMPPLRHRVGDEFDIMNSEVAEWLCSQPAVRQYLFDAAKELKVIVFDQETGTWSGCAKQVTADD